MKTEQVIPVDFHKTIQRSKIKFRSKKRGTIYDNRPSLSGFPCILGGRLSHPGYIRGTHFHERPQNSSKCNIVVYTNSYHYGCYARTEYYLLDAGRELSKDFYQVAPDWHWKEPALKRMEEKRWGEEKEEGKRQKEGRRGGGDWGEMARLPPWMWKEELAGSSERFRATGDDNLFATGHDNFLPNYVLKLSTERFRRTSDDSFVKS